METKVCQNCKNEFVIEPDDFGFYEKVGVQAPGLCPSCRAQLRHIFRNERNFYKRNCDLCGESMITIWSQNKKTLVYCVPCWWSDKWDAKSFALEYDSGQDFFKQAGELYQKVPKPALVGMRNLDCQYVNYVADCKCCYMIVESSNNEDCIHSYWIQKTKDCVDVSFTHQVELSYELDDCYNSYRLQYCQSCYDCTDGAFLLNCRGCVNCLGCVNLRNKSYHIFNAGYSREEYLKKLKEFRLDTHSGVEKFKKEFENFSGSFPRKYAEIYMSVNTTGNYQTNVRNNRSCFHSYDAEDNAYSLHVWREARDCMDCHTAGRTAEKIYNSTNTGIQASNCICCHNCWSSNFVEYSFYCSNGKNLFGCIALKKGEYCILNKQYTKEEYESLRGEIVGRLKKEGKYGEYFPKEITLFGYNETTAMEEFPLTKEEALAKGFKWEDTPRGTYGKETRNWSDIPDSINDVDCDPNKDIFICQQCDKNYRIVQNELSFYKKLGIPLPRSCPDCRHAIRLSRRGPNRLWHRQCMCDRENHFHGKGKCEVGFETSYAPDRPEIVYCEKCYQQEVY